MITIYYVLNAISLCDTQRSASQLKVAFNVNLKYLSSRDKLHNYNNWKNCTTQHIKKTIQQSLGMVLDKDDSTIKYFW